MLVLRNEGVIVIALTDKNVSEIQHGRALHVPGSYFNVPGVKLFVLHAKTNEHLRAELLAHGSTAEGLDLNGHDAPMPFLRRAHVRRIIGAVAAFALAYMTSLVICCVYLE